MKAVGPDLAFWLHASHRLEWALDVLYGEVDGNSFNNRLECAAIDAFISRWLKSRSIFEELKPRIATGHCHGALLRILEVSSDGKKRFSDAGLRLVKTRIRMPEQLRSNAY